MSWNLGITGTYKLTKLFQGSLTAFGRVSMDQIIVNSSRDIFITKKNEFFLRDIQLGVLGQRLYKEKITGITFGANTNFWLPTSKLAQAAERILRWNIGFNAVRVFPGIGPGNLIFSGRHDLPKGLWPRLPDHLSKRVCEHRQRMPRQGGQPALASPTCRTTTSGWIYGVSVAYAVAGFTISAGMTLFSETGSMTSATLI